MTLSALENKLIQSVYFLSSTMSPEGPYPLMAEKTDTVAALVSAMKEKRAKIAREGKEKKAGNVAPDSDKMEVDSVSVATPDDAMQVDSEQVCHIEPCSLWIFGGLMLVF